jgi:hypothetical protein
MSTAHLAFRCCAAIAMLAVANLPAVALELKSYKDELFAYPAILSQEDNGAFITVDYQEMRDINGRDEIPERRAKGKYVSLGAKRGQAFENISANGRSVDVLRVGDLAGATFAVIFIHGRGGDRKLGANDFSFGGNFNRLKNLAVENGGVYYAPSVKTFDGDGAADISALIGYIAQTSPQVKIVLSCASMGSFICWGITKEAKTVGELAGMMVMGGATDPDFSKSAAYQAKLPMFFSHGSHDSVYAAAEQVKLYKSLISASFPTRFVLFQTGSHGTPVRMTDWRDSLNWIFAQ